MEQTLKEKTLEREEIETTNLETARANAASNSLTAKIDERIITIVRAADDKKAVNSIVLDLHQVSDFTSFFIVTSGTNTRQVQAISDGIGEELRKIQSRPTRIEGYNTAEWILMDYGDIIVHVFEQKAREFYDLERLWRDARRVSVPLETKN